MNQFSALINLFRSALRAPRFVLVLIFVFSVVKSSAVQQAWVAHYNNGPGTTNQAIAMALDKDGNIYVAGHSTRTNAPYDYDYVLIKYNPLGVQQWVTRYGSAGVNDQVRAMVANTNGEVFITGTTETVQYMSNGALLWSASYAGRDITTDGTGNSYVTGFLTNDFSTVKIAPSGTNIWLRTWDLAGKEDFTQKITVDGFGNVFVAGLAVWLCDRTGCYRKPYIIKYDSGGSKLWERIPFEGTAYSGLNFRALAADRVGNLYIAQSLYPLCCSWAVRKIYADGNLGWGKGFYNNSGQEGVMAMALDESENVYLTGALAQAGVIAPSWKLTRDGTNIWSVEYVGAGAGLHRGRAIASDAAGNAYVTGQSSGTGTGSDYFTIKYGTNGQQLWEKRFTEAGDSDDQTAAIALSQSDDVYVTGFSNPTNGLYEITTIKYVQIAPIEKKSIGNVLLQFCGAPGSNYVIQATTNFPNWSTIGNATADSTGIYRFEDTNAPAYPNRFYRVEP